jgi:hypothetical protein
MQVVTTVGLDIAKSLFQVHGIDAAGRHGLGQCLAAVKVEARENPSGLAATKYRAASEAGYTSAVVTIEPDPVDLLQSGGAHIRPHMAQTGHTELHCPCPLSGVKRTSKNVC